jgi:3-oxoacid CoA-transferase subunit B
VTALVGQRLTSDQMAARVAREFSDGDIVNLGVGLPVRVADFVPAGLEVLLHSEQGVLGFGRRVVDGDDGDPFLVNAMRQCVQPLPGMSFMDHAESFALVRSGRIDVTVLGALEVSQHGDLANSWLPGRVTALLGGAQDIASCARMVVVVMPLLTKAGHPKLVERCSVPVTAFGVVDLVVTDVAVWAPSEAGLVLRERAPGWETEQLVDLMGIDIVVEGDVPIMDATL